jgi:hypothetical protein
VERDYVAGRAAEDGAGGAHADPGRPEALDEGFTMTTTPSDRVLQRPMPLQRIRV